MKETFYQLTGHDIYPVEWTQCPVNHIFRDREQAVQWLLDTIDENRTYLETDRMERGINYQETEHRVNGRVWNYEAIQEYDIRTPEGKAAWLECPRLSGCIDPECYNPTLGKNAACVQREMAVKLILREIEV